MLSRDLGDSGKFNPLSHWRRCGVLIVYFEHIPSCSSVSTVNFEQVNADMQM